MIQRHARGPALALELTRRCDRRCAYCYGHPLPEAADEPGALPTGALLDVVAAAAAGGGFTHVQLSGGEPLLRPDALEIIGWLRDRGLGVSLLTDGGRVDRPLARALARHGVGPVQLTVLSTEAATHDRLKGTPGALQRTLAGLAELVAAGVPVSLAFVCMRDTASEFEAVLRLAFGLGLPTVALARLCPVGSAGGRREELEPRPEDLESALGAAQRATQELGLRVPVAISLPHCTFPPERYPDLSFGSCALLGSAPGFTLDPSGRLRACSISETPLGDANTAGWAALRQAAERGYLAEARRLPAVCHGCARLARCRGGCRESARAATGRWGTLDPLARPTPRP